MVLIFLQFQRDTDHPHPHRDAALGKTDAEIAAAFQALDREAGLG